MQIFYISDPCRCFIFPNHADILYFPIMHAGAQPHGQGPFAQDRPSSSSPPPPVPTHLAEPQSQLPASNLPSTSTTLPVPAQHASLPPVLSAPADSAFPASSSFRFGSFSPEDVAKPSIAGTLSFPVPSGEQQHPGVQFGSVVPLGQLEAASVPRQLAGQKQIPFGPPQGPSPIGQPPSAAISAPVTSSAPGQTPSARHSMPKPAQPPVNSVQSSFTAAPQPSTGADSIPETVSASMHASTELPASQASNSLPVLPLPGRADSTNATSSQGHFNPDGMHLSTSSWLPLYVGYACNCAALPCPALPCDVSSLVLVTSATDDDFSVSDLFKLIINRMWTDNMATIQLKCARASDCLQIKCSNSQTDMMVVHAYCRVTLCGLFRSTIRQQTSFRQQQQTACARNGAEQLPAWVWQPAGPLPTLPPIPGPLLGSSSSSCALSLSIMSHHVLALIMRMNERISCIA